MAEYSDSDNTLEEIASEVEDIESSQPTYHIITYPSDPTLEVLVGQMKRDRIIIPGFQRKFVWRITQASRLVESFLLGLPVPPIYLYTEPNTEKNLVVDGQQRLRSIQYFYEGFFGPEERGRRKVFKLEGLSPNSPYHNLTYDDLDERQKSRLDESILRTFIIKQLNPSNDDSSIFHIFERLNTGGTPLVGQEIRNCIYHGPFNDLLRELNQDTSWRHIFGREQEDSRMRDIELILRFFALHANAQNYAKPMKDFLSRFMLAMQRASDDLLQGYKSLFQETTKTVLNTLGQRPFHIRSGLNVAVFDSVFLAFAKNFPLGKQTTREKYHDLIANDDYLKSVTAATTDEDTVRQRLALAEHALFG